MQRKPLGKGIGALFTEPKKQDVDQGDGGRERRRRLTDRRADKDRRAGRQRLEVDPLGGGRPKQTGKQEPTENEQDDVTDVFLMLHD